jgi:HEXXH motif-containing protein
MAVGAQPWCLPGQARVRPATQRGWLVGRVREAPLSVRRHIEAQSLILGCFSGNDTALLNRAEALIELVPSLATVVESIVDEVHLLVAETGYDVSHSEPRWRSKVFVSIPDRSDEVGALRFAEGVLHEAMHLELTVLESQQPIIADPQGTMTSPWKDDPRPFGGVAHGLFVFTCLRAFFDELMSGDPKAAFGHIRLRINEIRAETASIDLTKLQRGLTPLGAKLAAAWRDRAMV